MKLLLVGDIHGSTFDLKRAMKYAHAQECGRVFFLGDFGWWSYDNGAILKAAKDMHEETGLLVEFIDGNHEDFDSLYSYEIGDGGYRWLSDDLRHIPRGSMEIIDGKRILFMGGAISIDRSNRTKGKSWWPQESISDQDLITAFDVINQIGRPDMVLAHDGPALPHDSNKDSDDLWPYEWKFDLALSDLNREKLKVLAEFAKPKLWVHGHHHTSWSGMYEDTLVRCLDRDGGRLIDSTMLIDTEEL